MIIVLAEDTVGENEVVIGLMTPSVFLGKKSFFSHNDNVFIGHCFHEFTDFVCWAVL